MLDNSLVHHYPSSRQKRVFILPIPTFDELMAIVKSAIVKGKTRARIGIEQK
jgi:hypothetical protein